MKKDNQDAPLSELMKNKVFKKIKSSKLWFNFNRWA